MLFSSYRMPDVWGPECVKMHKTALSSLSSQRSNGCNRKVLLGDSLTNVIIGVGAKYSGEQVTNPFFKIMFGSYTCITTIKRCKIVYMVKFKSPSHPGLWQVLSSLEATIVIGYWVFFQRCSIHFEHQYKYISIYRSITNIFASKELHIIQISGW